MKATALAIVMTLATVSFASANEPIIVDAKINTCSDVQSILHSEGVIQIQGHWGLETHYSQRPDCGLGWVGKYTYVSTADRKYCAAGYICVADYTGGP